MSTGSGFIATRSGPGSSGQESNQCRYESKNTTIQLVVNCHQCQQQYCGSESVKHWTNCVSGQEPGGCSSMRRSARWCMLGTTQGRHTTWTGTSWRGLRRYTHKTSGFKTSGFKTSGFKTSGFKTSGLQNVRFTKRQVSKRLVSKRLVSKRP